VVADAQIHTKLDHLTTMVTDVRIATAEHTVQLRVLETDRLAADDGRAALERRVAALERWRYMAAGAGIVVGLVAQPLINAVMH
jgi:hypothetical protein